jgi:hypothetical protein
VGHGAIGVQGRDRPLRRLFPLSEGRPMPKECLQLQAARVLEVIQTLETQYGGVLGKEDPRLAQALREAAGALEHYVNNHSNREARDEAPPAAP